MQSVNNKKIAYVSLLVAIALIFSYVEILIPFNFGIPGVKLGLANVISIISIYLFGPYIALVIVVLRILLSGFLFGNLYSILYSLCGGILSIIVMSVIKKTNKFSIYGVSMCGGVFHNIGQLIVAMITVNQMKISYYGPILIVSGMIMGLLVGFLSNQILIRLKHMFDSDKIIS